jgi:hypothetical protein
VDRSSRGQPPGRTAGTGSTVGPVDTGSTDQAADSTDRSNYTFLAAGRTAAAGSIAAADLPSHLAAAAARAGTGAEAGVAVAAATKTAVGVVAGVALGSSFAVAAGEAAAAAAAAAAATMNFAAATKTS